MVDSAVLTKYESKLDASYFSEKKNKNQPNISFRLNIGVTGLH